MTHKNDIYRRKEVYPASAQLRLTLAQKRFVHEYARRERCSEAEVYRRGLERLAAEIGETIPNDN